MKILSVVAENLGIGVDQIGFQLDDLSQLDREIKAGNIEIKGDRLYLTRSGLKTLAHELHLDLRDQLTDEEYELWLDEYGRRLAE